MLHLWRRIGEEHQLVEEMVGRRDLGGATQAARTKLDLLLRNPSSSTPLPSPSSPRLGEAVVADLPAAYMEVFEFLAIRRAMGGQGEGGEQFRWPLLC